MKRVLARHSAAAQADRMPRTGGPRRAVLPAVLLLISFALMTVYFREGDGGPLHASQRALDSRFAPLEGGLQRVAQPFRDAAGWFDDIGKARRERDRLQRENAELRKELADRDLAASDEAELEREIHYVQSPAFPKLGDYVARGARVVSRSPQLYAAKVLIDRGSASGVQENDPVLSGVAASATGGAALVGRVTHVTADTAEVTLLNDASMAVGALDAAAPVAQGIIEPASGDPSTLHLDLVPKAYAVQEGEAVVTSGVGYAGKASWYPRGIPIGVVSLVAQFDTESFKTIQVTPWVDLQSFRTVVVLARPA
jgi:rod shape-determining protein MreC